MTKKDGTAGASKQKSRLKITCAKMTPDTSRWDARWFSQSPDWEDELARSNKKNGLPFVYAESMFLSQQSEAFVNC